MEDDIQGTVFDPENGTSARAREWTIFKAINEIAFLETYPVDVCMTGIELCGSEELDLDDCEQCPYFSDMPNCKEHLFHDLLRHTEDRKIGIFELKDAPIKW